MDGTLGEAVAGHDFRDLFHDVSALEVEDAFGELAFDPGIEVRERGDGAGDDEVEALRQGLRAGVDHLHVLKV